MLTIEELRDAVRELEGLRDSTGFAWTLAKAASYQLPLDGAIAEVWRVSESGGGVHWEARIGARDEGDGDDLAHEAGSDPAEAWAACVARLRRPWGAWLATQAQEAHRVTQSAPSFCRLCGVELAPIYPREELPPVCLACARLVARALGQFLPGAEEFEAEIMASCAGCGEAKEPGQVYCPACKAGVQNEPDTRHGDH